MNVKMLVVAAVSSVFLGSFAYAATATLVDDAAPAASGVMSGTGNTMSGNVGGMSGSNGMSGNGMSTDGTSGPSSMNNGTSDDGSADTATGDNDY